MYGLKRQLTTPYVPAAKRIRANNVLARAMRRRAKSNRNSSFAPIKSIGPEWKNFDQYWNNFDCASGAVLLQNPITAGVTPSSLVGRKAIMKNITYNYLLRVEPQSTSLFPQYGCEVVRILLVYDNSPQGVAPISSDIVDVTSKPNCVISPYSLKNTDRFKVLLDKRHTMGYSAYISGGITYTYDRGVPLDIANGTIPLNLPFEGPSTTGIIGVDRGAIWLLILTNQSISVGQTYFDGMTRIRYIDA